MNILYDLPSRGFLSVKGEGALKLLQGQLTCDVTEVNPAQTRLGSHCNFQGRVISLFRINWFNDQYLLSMPRSLIPIALAALKKYAVFFKVTLTDVSESIVQMGYSGDSFFTDLPEKMDEALIINDLLIIKPSDTSRYEIIGSPDNLKKLKEKLPETQSGSEEAWKCLEIEASIPTLYPETSEKFLPHELNLPLLNAVSFKKGCFTGQEIIARMEYRGKLKKHLLPAHVTSEHTPKRGADIYLGQEACGSIVDYCQLSYNTYDLLVIAADKDIESNAISLDIENKKFLNFKPKSVS